MNIVSKKLHELEKNMLPELPEKGTTKITWENGSRELDDAELELHSRKPRRNQRTSENWIRICLPKGQLNISEKT